MANKNSKQLRVTLRKQARDANKGKRISRADRKIKALKLVLTNGKQVEIEAVA